MAKFLFRLFILTLFCGTLFLIISYARGYRLNFQQKSLTPTGILVASSFPDGAKIYVDGILKGATNTNVTLPPKNYTIEIKKDGYIPWKKTISVKGEIVIKTDALLFPQNASLSPLTSLGVVASKFSPTTNQIVFISNTAEIDKDGVYILNNGPKTLSLFNPLKMLMIKSLLPANADLAQTAFDFSPDGKEVILSLCEKSLISPTPTPTPTLTTIQTKTCDTPFAQYLLSTDTEKQQPIDITKSVETVKAAWDREEATNINKILETFKDPIPSIASDSFKILSFSPDDSKILYKATKTLSIPLIINPALIGANQMQETRAITKGNIYVYDKKEDKNFQIPLTINLPSPTPTIVKLNVTPTPENNSLDDIQNKVIWYPDSRHLIVNENKQISILDYDGGNHQTVYSGPFEKDFLGVSNEGNLLIIANLNPNANIYPDVYTVGIR